MVLGNIAILVGSAIAGSVLTSGDGTIPGFGDVLSGAAKFVKKHGKEGKDATSNSDQHTAHLISQVSSLREEIQYLTSRQVTVVRNAATSGPGAFTITAVIVTGAIAYVYIKWKGLKFSDMMFVTKRGLSDACNVVGNQLNQVSDSVNVAKRDLAGRISRVDASLDETQQIIEGTRDEVAVINVDLSLFQENLQEVHRTVQQLGSKLGSLEYTQDRTAVAVEGLVGFTQQIEHGQNANIRHVSSSFHPAIESPSEQIVRRATSMSLPPPPPPPPPAAESSSRVEASQEKHPFSNGASSSTKESMGTPTATSSRFGGLSRLTSFLRSSAS